MTDGGIGLYLNKCIYFKSINGEEVYYDYIFIAPSNSVAELQKEFNKLGLWHKVKD